MYAQPAKAVSARYQRLNTKEIHMNDDDHKTGVKWWSKKLLVRNALVAA
jgi:hypothetical protein